MGALALCVFLLATSSRLAAAQQLRAGPEDNGVQMEAVLVGPEFLQDCAVAGAAGTAP